MLQAGLFQRDEIDAAYAQWRRAVDRAQGWADTEP